MIIGKGTYFPQVPKHASNNPLVILFKGYAPMTTGMCVSLVIKHITPL